MARLIVAAPVFAPAAAQQSTAHGTPQQRLRQHAARLDYFPTWIGLPPVGVSLLVACSVGGVEPAKVARPLAPYLALTLVIAFLPGVVLFLPNLLGY